MIHKNNSIILPEKIAWWMDLSVPMDNRWSHRQLKYVHKYASNYREKVLSELLPSQAIATHFYPLYKRVIMSKPDFHIPVEDVTITIDQLAHDENCALLWFSSPDRKIHYGGNVLRLGQDYAKGIFRAFDHNLTQEAGMQYFDYYADYVLQNMIMERGIFNFSRGLMTHPCISLGLLAFKLRSGAFPKKSWREDVNEILVTEDTLKNMARDNGICAFFCEPNEDQKYTKFVAYSSDIDMLNTYNLEKRLHNLHIDFDKVLV